MEEEKKKEGRMGVIFEEKGKGKRERIVIILVDKRKQR